MRKALGVGLTGAIFNIYLSRGDQSSSAVLVYAFDLSLLFTCAVALLTTFVCFIGVNDRPVKHVK